MKLLLIEAEKPDKGLSKKQGIVVMEKEFSIR